MNKDLVDKYLGGRCSKEETSYVHRYFKENPLDLENYFSIEDWQSQRNNNNRKIEEDLSAEIYSNIQSSVYSGKNNIYTITKWIGTAAAIMLLFFGVKYFYLQDAQVEKNIATTKTESVNISKNTTPHIQEIALPDGSLVLLSPGSEIKYYEDYNHTKRDIYLTGKAEFDVAGNKEKPFTVFCGKISTQALGTRFEVNGFAKNTSVVLFEGKVVVKNIENEKIQTYLKPGESTAFISSKNVFETVLRIVDRIATTEVKPVIKDIATESLVETDAKQKETIVKNINAGTKNTTTYLKFQNESLRSVINQLSQLYDVEINYPTEISSSINVYMSVDSRQPIEKILKNISSINGLEINKIDSNKYIISK